MDIDFDWGSFFAGVVLPVLITIVVVVFFNAWVYGMFSARREETERLARLRELDAAARERADIEQFRTEYR
jgi:hypothetical protein